MLLRVNTALRAEHFDATLLSVVDDEQPGSFSDHVARRVREVRTGLRMHYTELSQRLQELGCPIPVLGLRRIENRERRVDVNELAAIAAALEVTPLFLLLPADEGEEVAVTPGRVIPAVEAVRWFVGGSMQDADVGLAEIEEHIELVGPVISASLAASRAGVDPRIIEGAARVARSRAVQRFLLADLTKGEGAEEA